MIIMYIVFQNPYRKSRKVQYFRRCFLELTVLAVNIRIFALTICKCSIEKYDKAESKSKFNEDLNNGLPIIIMRLIVKRLKRVKIIEKLVNKVQYGNITNES